MRAAHARCPHARARVGAAHRVPEARRRGPRKLRGGADDARPLVVGWLQVEARAAVDWLHERRRPTVVLLNSVAVSSYRPRRARRRATSAASWCSTRPAAGTSATRHAIVAAPSGGPRRQRWPCGTQNLLRVFRHEMAQSQRRQSVADKVVLETFHNVRTPKLRVENCRRHRT